MQIGVLRELLRNLQAFRVAYENDGLDEITGPDGVTYHLIDIEYIYSQVHRLSTRQRQAIELCLVSNIRERDVATMMGLSPTNPVASYATDGLRKLCDLINSGGLHRYHEDEGVVA